MKRISFIAICGILLFSAHAASATYTFQGPTQQPTSGNVPGVIWNVAGTAASQPTAEINIGGQASVGNVNTAANDSVIKRNIFIETGRAFRVDNAGASTYNMGNWFSGSQPFTFTINGGLRTSGITANPLLGEDGRVQADKYCFNPGNPLDCITAWPSGGGAYVLKAGDTMTGALTINKSPGAALTINGGADALTVNGGNAGNSAVLGTNVLGGFGVRGNGSGGIGGYGGYFTDNVSYSYLGGQGYGLFTNGDITTSNNLCLGGVCKNAWPTATAGGANGQIQFNNAGALGADAQLNWDNVNKKLGINVVPAAKIDTLNTVNNEYAAKFVATGANTTIHSPPGVGGVYAEGSSYGIFASSTATAGKFINQNALADVDIASTGGYGIDAITRSPTVYAGYFRNKDTIGTTYGAVLVGGRNYSIASIGVQPSTFQGNISLTNSSSPTTNGNLLLPIQGAIHFDGTLGTAGLLQLWSDNNFYWNMGTGNTINIKNNLGTLTPFSLGPNGSMLANGTNAEYRFTDRSNTANIWSLYANAGTAALYYAGDKFRFTTAGAASKADGSGSWSAWSDERLKDIISKYDNGLDEISRINTVKFSYKPNNPLGLTSGVTKIGATAQSLRKIIPEAVSVGKDGYLTVDNDPILWASVNAIKELKAENDKLKAKNDELEKRLYNIESRLNKLK